MEFRLPELGEGVNEGELVKWKVKPGDTVKFDQPLCEVMTDKATIEIPSPFEGKVLSLGAKEGKAVKVEEVLLTYEGGASVAASAHAAPAAHGAPAPVPHKPAPAIASAPAVAAPVASATVASATGVASGATSAGPAVPQGTVLAAPSTRRLAREVGVDLSMVSGSGPAGRIVREDIERALKGITLKGPAVSQASVAQVQTRDAKTLSQLEERVPFVGLRKKISEKMRLSKDKAAHFTYVEEADATDLVKLRNQAKIIGEAQGIKVTYLPFVMKAMVEALKRFPIVNSTLDEVDGQIVYKKYYNIGISIQTEEGLTAPVVKDVEHKPILQLAQEIQSLVDRARKKQLTKDDFTGGTITITNAGSIGGLFATPVINFPEVAILGLNKIARKPVVQTINGKEEIVIRDWTYFSISCDHRVVDGAIAAEFMKLFIRYIETPSLLLLGQ